MSFTVTPSETTSTPISSLLYGHFIELGYGIQVEPMWSEMFFNRSFESFSSYKWINKEWYDLWLDPHAPDKGYKADWSGEDWYHSGYEHNPWFAVPGEEGPLDIIDGAQFIIENAIGADVTITRTGRPAVHGDTYLRVENQESAAWGGFAQAGKFLRKGAEYRFTGYLRSDDASLMAEIRIFRQGDWTKPLHVTAIGPIGSEWTEFSATFINSDYEGRAVFSFWIPPSTSLGADCFSLMPVATRNGWRIDVVEAAERVNPKIIRWPGGCFASFYNWRDGIGPYNQRRPQPSYFWGGQNYNDVGTAELASLAKMLGSESMVCVNLYHPAKQFYEVHWDEYNKGPHGFDFPHFTDVYQGAKDAADWVAYCNLPAGAHPMADLRAEHGYSEPWGVQFWEIDNEALRWFTPVNYATDVVIYSRAMKAVDPSIKIGLITYGDEYKAQISAMLDIAGHDIDFVADRAWGEAGLLRVLDSLRTYNAVHGTQVKYCDTEWLAHQDEPDAFNNVTLSPWQSETKSYRFSKWRYAMNIFRNFMMWQRCGGDVLFVNFNNFANTHSQCVIDTPKEGAFLTAAGRVFELLSRTPAAWPLALDGYLTDSRADFQAQAAWNIDRTELVLYVLNMTENDEVAQFSLAGIGRVFDRSQLSRLSAPSLTSMNTLTQPNVIVRTDYLDNTTVISGDYAVASPARSITHIVLA